ncbi:MAG: DinB family protein [Acidimicrobiales bacterium]
MASSESCEGCGFRWSDVSAGEIPGRTASATSHFVELLVTSASIATRRPAPDRWSILEYAAHMRDVFMSIRERIVRACIEENSVGSPIYRDERVNLGFYKLDTPDDVATELLAMSRLFVRTFEALPPTFEQRVFTYSPLTDMKVTVLWAGAQALHECEHHLGDVRENVELLNA